MEKIEKTSLDIQNLNIEKLKELFPNCVTEGKINFDALKSALGEDVDESKEKYQFTWNGKTQAIKNAQNPSTATLRPCKEKSKDWDNTNNIYIEGDNLEVLKQLQKTYFKKIKMIYIDPPYNTGHDFVYKDNFVDSIENYIEQTNQTSSSNPETSGRYHTDWLNMMYSRLLVARNLLKDNGVIFISIDDNEDNNLSKMCEEIFGEDNFVCKFIWKSKLGKVGTTSLISSVHEYILCYAKNINNANFKMIKNISEGRKENLRQWGVADRREDRPSMFYPISINGIEVYPIKEDGTEGRWRVGEETAKELLDQGMLELSEKNGKYNIYRNFPSGESYTPFSTLLLDDIGTTAKGATTLKELGLEKVFDYSKPTELIEHFINLCTSEDDIIMDFFSGSGTTAHSVMKANECDEQKRKFIMIQLPEQTFENSEAFRQGYKTITDIGEKRIKNAGEMLKENWIFKNKGEGLLEKDVSYPMDIGFKVFKLDSTNINPWDNEKIQDENDLFNQVEVFKPDRTKEDVLYEIMLKYGIFDQPVSVEKINGKEIFKVGSRYMVVCLEDEITSEDVKKIGELKPRVVVFKESGFANDNDKINTVYNLEKAGVEDVRSI